jgi:diguanylate cyclase (GGDEF)-like protein/PAS domain S-box-containing protein
VRFVEFLRHALPRPRRGRARAIALPATLIAATAEFCIATYLLAAHVGTAAFAVALAAVAALSTIAVAVVTTIFQRSAREATEHAERRAAELSESEARFRAMSDASPVGMFLSDEAGRVIYANAAFQQLTGDAGTSPVPWGWGARAHPEDRARVFAERAAALKERRPFDVEARFIRPDSSIAYAHVRASALAPSLGSGARFVGLLEDVTARHEVEERLRVSERQFRNLFDSIGDPIVVTGTDRRIIMTNPAFKEAFGYPDDTVLAGQPTPLLYAADSDVAETGARILENASGAPMRLDTHVAAQVRRALNGEVVSGSVEQDGRSYDLRYSPLRGDDRRSNGVVWVALDVTERHLAEQLSARTQANLTALIENGEDVIWSVSADYALLSSNAAFQEMVRFHLGRNVAVGESVVADDFGDHLPGWTELYDRALGGEKFIAEMDVAGARGVRRHEVRLNPVREVDGTVIGATVFSRDVTERRLSEMALRESEERYRTTFENLHDSFFETNLDDEFIMASPSIKRLHGWSVGEMLGRRSRTLYADPERQDALIAELEAGREVNDFEAELLRSDGSSFYASINAKVMYDEGRRPIAVQGTARDITQRKRMEDALRESEARYRATFESLHDVFYQADRDALITLLSPSCLRHTGYTPDELVGLPIRTLFGDEGAFAGLVSELIEHDTINDAEAIMRTKSGELVPVSVNATMLRDADGNFRGAQGTLRDISERKRAQAERDRIFNLTVDMLSVVAPGGRLLRVNPAWEATLGYSPDDVVGTNVWDMLHPDDLRAARRGARAIDEGRVVTDLRSRFRCKDGSWRWLGWSMTRTNEDGAVYAVARDVTELMETQLEMLRVHGELEMTLNAMRASQLVLEKQAREMDRLRIEAEHLANHDTLTGVANRRAWFNHATATKPTAIAIFDIDLFKKVNDTFGHPAGDEVLRQVAGRLQAVLPPDALLGRLGGEEFAVLFHGSFADARAASDAAVRSVSGTPITLEGSLQIEVAVSGGLAPWRPRGRSGEESLANTYEEADVALYEAKTAGRRRLVAHGNETKVA